MVDLSWLIDTAKFLAQPVLGGIFIFAGVLAGFYLDRLGEEISTYKEELERADALEDVYDELWQQVDQQQQAAKKVRSLCVGSIEGPKAASITGATREIRLLLAEIERLDPRVDLKADLYHWFAGVLYLEAWLDFDFGPFCVLPVKDSPRIDLDEEWEEWVDENIARAADTVIKRGESLLQGEHWDDKTQYRPEEPDPVWPLSRLVEPPSSPGPYRPPRESRSLDRARR